MLVRNFLSLKITASLGCIVVHNKDRGTERLQPKKKGRGTKRGTQEGIRTLKSQKS